jgi:GT2 family glycosyltransferase
VNDIAWWDGELVSNSAAYHHPDAGGGELTFRGLAGSADDGAPGEVQRATEIDREVDTIYGVMMALSPWAVANLRFDESIGMLHGYDFDICRQARAAGRKVITADLRLAHHHSLDLVTQIEIWVGAHMRAAEAWDDTTPPPDAPDEAWRERARRAEASAAAARLLAASKLLQADASSQMYARELGFVQSTRSWRMTESLRRANALVRAARRRLKGGPAS